jgi:putative toxin-antitoxin system antitoxin component (TIGR02293 family)
MRMPDVPLDIHGLAVDVFGDRGAADRWLNSPLSILGGKSPLEIARSEAGAAFVAQMLAKIDWGAAA